MSEFSFFVTRAFAANESDGASLQARTCSLACTSIHHRHLLAKRDKLRHASFYANHPAFHWCHMLVSVIVQMYLKG